MATALPTELQPIVVTERVSRIKLINTELQKFWGFQDGGPNSMPVPVRSGTYDVFNDTREVATSVVPGSPSQNVAPQPFGTVNFAIPEVNENVLLTAEKLFNLRTMGAGGNVIDMYGMNYVAEQEARLKQRLVNFREFQAAALMRGSYSFTAAGGSSAFSHSFSGGTYTVDYKVPSTHKTTINSIIGTTWANIAATIVTDILDINAFSSEETGRGIKHAHCNSTMWQNIVSNTQVQNLAGSVNQPYEISRNNDSEDYTAVLKAIPWLTFHINDNGLNLSGTFTKFFADTQITFTVEPGSDIASYYTCPTPVVEYEGGPILGVNGEKIWHMTASDPAGYKLRGCLSGLPALKVPKGIFCATAVF